MRVLPVYKENNPTRQPTLSIIKSPPPPPIPPTPTPHNSPGNLFHNADIEFPGYLSKSADLRFADVPNGISGLFSIPVAGLAQIVFFCGVCELAIWPAKNYSGDYGCGYGRPFVPNVLEGEELKYKLDMEINQGRAAMMGIFGSMVGEMVTGQTMAEQYASGNLFGYGPP